MKPENFYKIPKVFIKLTGLTPDKFREMHQRLEPMFEEAEYNRKNRPDRRRRQGAGPKPKLTVEQALFMFLLYYRIRTSQAILGCFMEIDGANVGRYLKKIKPLVAQIMIIPDRKTLGSENLYDILGTGKFHTTATA